MHRRLVALQARKEIVDARIEKEHRRPRPDTLRLQALKRRRLELKDRIALLTARVRKMIGEQAPA